MDKIKNASFATGRNAGAKLADAHALSPTTEGTALADGPLNGMKIAHLGTYPPRKCGIATYTQDVVSAVHTNTLAAPPSVVAMTAPDEDPQKTGYGWPVAHLISQDNPEEYVAAAKAIKRAGIDLVNIQYEHGIFGGDGGNFLNYFLDELVGSVPVVVTTHTVLPQPEAVYAKALKEVADRATRFVVLNSRALPLLESAYGIRTDNVAVIPHGTPNIERSRRRLVRQRFAVEGQTVLSTFGLLSPGKGLEHAIAAVAANAAMHPSLHYYILGATHPGVVRRSGEAYREGLMKQAADAGIADRVHFVNQYLALDEVTDWLLATDVYVTPYLNPNQITSGTLAYAVAAGKPVLSTPYLHAQEILDNGRGVLTPFNDPAAMGRNLDAMLTDTARLAEMAASAWEFGRQSVWSEVAKRHGEVFADATGRTGVAAIAAHTPSAIAVALDAAMADEDALLAGRSTVASQYMASTTRR
ncbi:MAG: glycosyltransferase [Akkermansiaceae bacterium]|nr:glycosyltransferase [Armatimonadota bacterium]